jgi:hypothetical protein
LLPAVCAFVLTVGALLPAARSEVQHPDEAQYVWSGAYYGRMVAKLDFRTAGGDELLNPGWSPQSWWALTQPFGSRAVYAIALWISGTQPPARPYLYDDPAHEDAQAVLSATALWATRLAAIACAALGLALIAWRLGWRGLAAGLVLLALPNTRGDLARAWAEGPLLFGFGLTIAAYGSRWLAPIVGLAAAFKLTGLALWPIAAVCAPIGRSRARHVLAVMSAAAVWTLLTPPAWFAGGPLYLLRMLVDRRHEYAMASASNPGILGLFLPSRYVWPAELGLLLLVAALLPRTRFYRLATLHGQPRIRRALPEKISSRSASLTRRSRTVRIERSSGIGTGG